MAFDGLFLASVLGEIREAEQCHIDKIYQPSRDELVFLLRKKGFAKRLLMCVRSGSARMHFTEKAYENPATPPMFCMLARKHFSAARLVGVRQYGLDRIAELLFEATSELGDRVSIKIVCELMGNQANVILVGSDGRILDALRRSDIENAKRIIQPGAVYEYPPHSDKLRIDEAEKSVERISENPELPLSKAIMDSVEGVSPLVSREVAVLAKSEGKIVGECDKELLNSALKTVADYAKIGRPTILFKGDEPFDFSYMPITQYGGLYEQKIYNSLGALLDVFYASREAAAFIKHAAGDILRLTENLITRAEKRRGFRIKDLEDCKNCEQLRIYGELVKANIHIIPAGATSVTVQNFYDENLSEVTIPLNPALSAAANAAKYFKSYKKSHTAAGVLEDFIEADKIEIEYLESVRESINRCKTAADIAEIREELRQEGYIKAAPQRGKKRQVASAFLEYKSVEGFRIAVGKNNTQNDLLTLKTANKNDMWFHTKNVHGSHVIVFCGGKELSDETVVFAARLAALNSKAAESSNVAVDYTPVKYVKKPAGAKAGMVIYTTNKTVYVTPKEAAKND